MTEIVPSQGVPQAAGRMSRWQLAVIGAVVALAAGIGLVLGFTLVGERGAGTLGTAASYLPADTVMYGEARLDLSPAQATSLRAILHRFPAADEDVVLLDAIGEALDQGFTAAGSSLTYDKDVAPWFDGRVAFAALDYRIGPIMDVPNAKLPSVAAMLGVKDAAAASAFGDALRELGSRSGVTLSSSQHAGVTIWSSPDSETNSSFAYAVTADQLLVANGRPTIEKLLDAHAGGQSLASRDELQQLIAHLPTDWVGFAAVDTRQIMEELKAALQQTDPSAGALLDPYLASVPPFAVTTVSLQDDAVAFNAAAALPSGGLQPTNSTRDLAASVPQDAIFFADGGNVGTSLAQAINSLRASLAAMPDGATADQQLEQMEAALGANLDDFVSWIDSGAMAAGWDGEQAWFGLVLDAADADAAAQRLAQLRGLVQLAASSSTAEVKVTTADHNGVEITTVRFFTPMAPLGSDGAGLDTVLQWALDGDRAFIGVGDRFVSRALDQDAPTSLQANSRFTTSVQRFGGADNASSFFLDLAALRTAVEGAAPDMVQAPEYTEVRQNLEPLDYVVQVTRVEGNVVVTRGGLVLR